MSEASSADQGLALWPLVERRAAATPDALFAVDEHDRELSFEAYRDAALRVAAGLHALGVREDSVVSWQLPTRLQALVLTAGLARLGAVQNPVLPFLRQREVGFIVRQCGARLLAVPRSFRGFDHLGLARALAAELPGLALLDVDAGLPEGDPARLPPLPADLAPADAGPVRWIFYSSGTTADPKGAKHADSALARVGRSLVETLELRAEDRNALVFPLTHIGGIGWLFAGLQAGSAQILVESFEAKATVDVLERHGCTVAGAGTVFHQAYLAVQRERGAARVLPRVRVFPGGGAPKPPGLHAEMKRVFGGAGVVAGYGLTEHPVATMSTLRDPDAKLAACEGRATPGTEIRVVRADGALAAPGEEGEIRLRGPHLCRGYVDSALDADAFDEQGFLRSGDLGHLDADGYLVVTGRLKDVIIRKGENISAKEIEDHLSAHPKLRDVAVVGLPDAERGERACAFVVPADPAAPPTLAELAAFLRARGLAAQKLPEQLELLAELPRNASGKVLKRELRKGTGSTNQLAAPRGSKLIS
jgi:acyl-CoA synthetase (AMP-forming)/AMP-acid ligase II